MEIAGVVDAGGFDDAELRAEVAAVGSFERGEGNGGDGGVGYDDQRGGVLEAGLEGANEPGVEAARVGVEEAGIGGGVGAVGGETGDGRVELVGGDVLPDEGRALIVVEPDGEARGEGDPAEDRGAAGDVETVGRVGGERRRGAGSRR